MEYLLVIAIAAIAWLVFIDRPILKVTIKAGTIAKVRGHFPPKFRHNVIEIGEVVPYDGEFKVYQTRQGVKLTFSKQVPKKIQQRIRNVFPHQGFKSKGEKRA